MVDAEEAIDELVRMARCKEEVLGLARAFYVVAEHSICEADLVSYVNEALSRSEYGNLVESILESTVDLVSSSSRLTESEMTTLFQNLSDMALLARFGLEPDSTQVERLKLLVVDVFKRQRERARLIEVERSRSWDKGCWWHEWGIDEIRQAMAGIKSRISAEEVADRVLFVVKKYPSAEFIVQEFKDRLARSGFSDLCDRQIEYMNRIASEGTLITEDMYKLFSLLDAVYVYRELGLEYDNEAYTYVEQAVRECFARQKTLSRSVSSHLRTHAAAYLRHCWWYSEIGG